MTFAHITYITQISNNLFSHYLENQIFLIHVIKNTSLTHTEELQKITNKTKLSDRRLIYRRSTKEHLTVVFKNTHIL